MLQESTSWDWRQLHPLLSTTRRVYLWFLFAPSIVTCVKLIRAWTPAPPFSLPRQDGNLAFVRMLQSLSASLKLWIGCVLIGWGVSASTSLFELTVKLLEEKQIRSFAILFPLLGFSTTLTGALGGVLFMFMA